MLRWNTKKPTHKKYESENKKGKEESFNIEKRLQGDKERK